MFFFCMGLYIYLYIGKKSTDDARAHLALGVAVGVCERGILYSHVLVRSDVFERFFDERC